MYGTKMIARRILSICLLLLLAISARGQVLSDGISGRDLKHNMQFIQAISPQGDTCLVMTDSLGRFEIDPELMEGMRGNVYLKPMVAKPRPKLVIDSPFDSINVMRRGQTRYLSQNHIFEADTEEPVIYYDPGTTLLKESVVKAKRHAVARDKVTGYLDSLTIMSTGAWVCDCVKNPNLPKTLNNYKGWHAHRADYPPPLSTYTGKRLQPKRGEVYGVVRYEPWGPNGEWIIAAMDEIVYDGPQYTEEELLEMNGMWKAQGYYPQREFYEPDAIDLASPTPDFRNLLQWKPAVITDENGEAEISIAASDVNAEFIGIIEAVDGTGLFGAQTVTFRVYKF